jgi:hypothetical protein
MKRIGVLAGVAIIEVTMVFVLTAWTDHSHIETTDFLNFYAAATIVRQGQGHMLYRAATQEKALQDILGRRVAEFYLHPPFEAAALVPLSYLRIERAFVAWTLVNLALLGLLPLLFAEYISFVALKPHLGLLVFAFPPVLAALTLGQDSIAVLFLISGAYLLLTKKMDFYAGLLLALATVKFQYVLILALLLLFSRKFRLIAGFAVGCAALVIISLLVTGPEGILGYVRFVHQFDIHNGYGNIPPDRMMNFRGFCAALGWTQHLRIYSAVGSALLVALGFICSRSSPGVDGDKLNFSLDIPIALAAAPYNYFQDSTILLLPIFLVMDLVISGRFSKVRGKLIVACCIMLFLWPAILLAAGGHYFWNSRIHLFFPLILIFIFTLAAEIYQRKPNWAHAAP